MGIEAGRHGVRYRVGDVETGGVERNASDVLGVHHLLAGVGVVPVADRGGQVPECHLDCLQCRAV